MKILFITVAWPKPGSENLYSDLIKKFRDEGHSVSVACSAPKRDGVQTAVREEDGIQVLRIKTGNISKTGHLEKVISLLMLKRQFKRAIYKFYGEKTFDLILFNTPPVTLSGLLRDLKKKYGCPLYLLLKDIWPYGFVDLGVIKQGGLAWKYFRMHEKRLYNTADYIGCMSPKSVKFVEEHYPDLDSSKIEVCPNSAYLPEKNYIKHPEIRKKYGIPENATVFLFSGNLGKGHGLDFLTNAIKRLDGYEKTFFLIGGAGTHFKKIEDALNRYKPQNAFLYSFLPREDFERILGICDVGLILLDNKYTYPQFPSRLLGYLQAKMAVLCAVNKETDIGDIVESAQAGIQVNHGDMDSFINAVKKLSEEDSVRSGMGVNAYNLLKDKYTVQHSYDIIMNHFK